MTGSASAAARPRCRHRVVALALAAALVTSTAACSAADDPAPDVAELDFDPVATLVVDDDGFDPDQLELTAGDSITLVNEGDEPHSFVSTDPVRDTGELQPGEEVLLRFDEDGEVEAHDGTEADHTVTIVVAEAPSA